MKSTFVKSSLVVFIILFLCACDSKDDDMENPNLDNVGFDIDVSGSISRNMTGTNATYRFLEMPSSFVTSHQVAIYLTDSEGYTVIAFILLNEASLPSTGTYNVSDILGSTGLQEFDAGFSFGQNGGISHNTIGGDGSITITETGNNFVKGTITGGLVPTGNGTGNLNIQGSFYAEYKP